VTLAALLAHFVRCGACVVLEPPSAARAFNVFIDGVVVQLAQFSLAREPNL
jgi:CBS-domain-containing membrane protein